MSRIKRAGWILFLMLCCAVLLTACGGDTAQPKVTEAPAKAAAPVLTFVAADKTNWDKEITIGDYAYTLAVNLEDGGKRTLVATCTGVPAAQGNGGSGGSGGGNAEPSEEPVVLTDEQKAAQNFTQTGTWTYEKGYGYTVTINGYTTKTSYDKASARQQFYAVITNNGAPSGLTEFQAKDTAFRSEMAADYQDYEARDALYMFGGTGSTATGNASSTKVYLEKDGVANSIVQSGSSPTYTRGTWTENADKSLSINLSGAYTADYCDVAGKEGYRLTYNSQTMYSNTAVEYVDADFDGATKITLQCAEGDYTVNLTEKGFAVIYKNGEKNTTTKYTEDDDNITIVLDGTPYTSADGQIALSIKSSSGNNSSGNNDPDNRTFNLDGSKPEGAAPAAAPAGEGESEGDSAGAPAEGEDAAPAGEGEEASDGASAGEAAEGEEGASAGDGASDGAPAEGEGAPEQ